MDYESSLTAIKNKHDHFDVILVDPFHTFEQSFNDIKIALSLVSDAGMIIVHDCNPKYKKLTGNKWVEGGWTGQTYESFIYFRSCYPHVESCVVDIDYGCGIIRPNCLSSNSISIPQNMTISDVAKWEYFTNHRKELLNIIDINQFKKLYQTDQS